MKLVLRSKNKGVKDWKELCWVFFCFSILSWKLYSYWKDFIYCSFWGCNLSEGELSWKYRSQLKTLVLKHCFLCAKNRLISAKHSFLLLKPHSVTIVWNAVVTCEKPELKLGKSLYKPMHFIIIFAFYFLNSLRNCEKEKCFNIF